MPEISANKLAEGRSAGRALTETERHILDAIARIEYGSVEIVIHDGRVVQIECREKIRLNPGDPLTGNRFRQIR
jgi:hypothetical protein